MTPSPLRPRYPLLMCYSAQIKSDYLQFLRETASKLSLDEFVRIYWHRQTDKRVKTPKAMDAMFANPRSAK